MVITLLYNKTLPEGPGQGEKGGRVKRCELLVAHGFIKTWHGLLRLDLTIHSWMRQQVMENRGIQMASAAVEEHTVWTISITRCTYISYLQMELVQLCPDTLLIVVTSPLDNGKSFWPYVMGKANPSRCKSSALPVPPLARSRLRLS